MKQMANAIIVVAVVSLIVGVISRLMVVPIRGIEAHAFLEFSGVCLLLAIALILQKK